MADGFGWGLVVSTVFATAAWIYQKAWDRAEARRARYEAILADLSAFTVSNNDPDRIDAVLAEQRKLWLTAPQSVTDAFAAFLEGAEGLVPLTDAERSARMEHLVRVMREDTRIWSVLRPRLRRETISSRELALKSASRSAPPPADNM